MAKNSMDVIGMVEPLFDSLPKLPKNACDYINGAEYTNMIDEIKSSQAVYGAWGDWLIKGVDMARAACKDGAINESEMKSLQDYFKTAPAPNITMPANY